MNKKNMGLMAIFAYPAHQMIERDKKGMDWYDNLKQSSRDTLDMMGGSKTPEAENTLGMIDMLVDEMKAEAVRLAEEDDDTR